MGKSTRHGFGYNHIAARGVLKGPIPSCKGIRRGGEGQYVRLMIYDSNVRDDLCCCIMTSEGMSLRVTL